MFPDKSTTQDFAHEKNTKAPEGAAVGGTVGLGTGAVIGLLAGIGSLAGALIGLGIPEYEAKRYERKVKGGSALISVHTETSAARDKVKQIFEQAHAEDISSTSEASV